MKRIRKTGRRAIAVVVAVVLGVGYIAVNASETEEETKVVEEVVVTPSTWYFIGSTMADVFNPLKWQDTDPQNANCSQSVTLPLPCIYTVTDEDIADTTALVEYLERTHDDDPTEVAPSAESRKNEE